MTDDDDRSEEVASYDGSDDERQRSASSVSSPAFHVLTTAQLQQWVTANNQVDVGCNGNVVWSVSSAKHGSGVRHLMNYHDLTTFWQSDGVLPHVIRIQLGQLTPVEAVALYVNSAVDQSYSPRVMKVKAGTHEGDMTEVAKVDIGAGQECGWVLLELGDHAEPHSTTGNADGGQERREKKRERRRRSSAAVSDAAAPPAHPIAYAEVAAVVSGGAVPSTSASPAFPAAAAAASTEADRWLWCTMMDICICENQFNGRDCHLRGICLAGPRYEELERELHDDGAVSVTRGGDASVRAILHGGRQSDVGGGGGSGVQKRGDAQDWQLR